MGPKLQTFEALLNYLLHLCALAEFQGDLTNAGLKERIEMIVGIITLPVLQWLMHGCILFYYSFLKRQSKEHSCFILFLHFCR